MNYSKCPKCKKRLFDPHDKYCVGCGFPARLKLRLPPGPWKSWTAEIRRGSGLFLHLTASQSAPDDIYVDIEKQVGSSHISEAGFDRRYFKDGKVPLNDFKKVCEKNFAGRIPQSKKTLARVLKIAPARLGQLVRKRKINIKHDGSAWLPRSTMTMKIGYRACKMVGVDKRTGRWPHVVKAEDL